MRGLYQRLRAAGLPIGKLDLGGGLGVPYFNQPAPPEPAEFAAMANRVFESVEVELSFEPGRVIAANAGVLLSSVIHVHARPEGRRFLVLDAAMNDLIRPAMYDAYHDIRALRAPAANAILQPYDVVGPVCETGDTFTRDRMLPRARAGRPRGLHVGGGLRRGDVERVQHPAPGPRGAGRRRPLRRGPPPPDL